MDAPLRYNGFNKLTKRLKVNGKYFVFDSNVNRLLPMDQPAFSILPYYRKPEHALKRFKNRFTQTEIEKSLANFESLYQKGYFKDRLNVKLPFTKESFKKNVGKKTKSFVLSIIEQCNLRCKYCLFSKKSEGFRDHSNKEMDIHTAKKAMDLILKSNAEKLIVGLYGGEPLLKFDLIKSIIDYTGRKNCGKHIIQFNITTNGTLLTKEVVDYFVRNNVKINVSLDGPEKIQNRHRVFVNEAGSFAPIMKNLKYIKTKYPDYFKTVGIVAVIVPPYDYEELEHFFSHGNDFFTQNNLILTDLSTQGNSFFLEEKQRYFTGEKFKSALNSYRVRISNKLVSPGFSPNIFQRAFIDRDFGSFAAIFTDGESRVPGFPKYCKPGISKIYINTTGACYICENVPSSMPIGDIENGISADTCFEIFHDYMKVAGKRCLNCWAFSFCHLCLKDFLVLKNNRFVDNQTALNTCDKVKRSITRDFESFLNTVSKNPEVLNC